MTKQTVEFVAMKTIKTPFVNTLAFQFRPDRPAKWLQRVCLFVLHKLRAYNVGEMVSIQRATIDGTTFMERLLKQEVSFAEFFRQKPTRLLIGAEDYAALMREQAVDQAFMFPTEYYINREIYGMRVYVIPWMRGCLVLPTNLEDMRCHY